MRWILSARLGLATASAWFYSLLLGMMLICPRPIYAVEQRREIGPTLKSDVSPRAPVDPHQTSILGELRALREDVRTVRRDVNRLIELLENRQGARDGAKQEEVSGERSDAVDRDVPAPSWAMTLREAITIALQNDKTVTAVSAGSTPQEPIVIRRKNADTSLIEAKDKVAGLVKDVEQAYWDLWLAYRNLEAVKQARDAGERSFLSRDTVEDASRSVHAGEQRLRYLLGLSGDGRLIWPSGYPSLTKPSFEWTKMQAETLQNSPRIARQRWQVRRSELELAAVKAGLAPNGRSQPAQVSALPQALPTRVLVWRNNTPPDHEELPDHEDLPIEDRAILAGIRNAQMGLARERAVLEDFELDMMEQLADAARKLEKAYVLAQTQSARRRAAEQEVETLTARQSNTATTDVLADAQNRRDAAAVHYWKSLADFANAMSDVHFKKGTLLGYRNIVVDDTTIEERDDPRQTSPHD